MPTEDQIRDLLYRLKLYVYITTHQTWSHSAMDNHNNALDIHATSSQFIGQNVC